MAKVARLRVTLIIRPGSPLAGGRLPLVRRERDGGFEVVLDPVSFAALLASVGKLFPIDQVAAEMAAMGKVSEPERGQSAQQHGREVEQ